MMPEEDKERKLKHWETAQIHFDRAELQDKDPSLDEVSCEARAPRKKRCEIDQHQYGHLETCKDTETVELPVNVSRTFLPFLSRSRSGVLFLAGSFS